MSKMVDRIGQAIHEGKLNRSLPDDVARAVLECLREPTDEMMVEAETVAPQLATFAEKEQSPSYRVWRAMIAEALK